TAGADTRDLPRRPPPAGGILRWRNRADLTHGDDPIGRQYWRPRSDQHDKTLGLTAQCRTSLAGAFANSASNCEISRVKSSKLRWRRALAERSVLRATVLTSAVRISSKSMVFFSPLNEPYSA